MFFRCKVTKKSRNMQIFALKIPSTATAITLLPPLLPPLNIMKIRLLPPKVAVVAVKITKHLVYKLRKNAYPCYITMPILVI